MLNYKSVETEGKQMTKNSQKQPFFAIDGPMGSFSTQNKADLTLKKHAKIGPPLIILQSAVTVILADSLLSACVLLIMVVGYGFTTFQKRIGYWILCLIGLLFSALEVWVYVNVIVNGASFKMVSFIDVIALFSCYRMFRALIWKDTGST